MIYYGPNESEAATMTNTIQAATIESLDSGVLAISFPTLEEGNTLAGLQAAVGGYVDCFDIVHPSTGAIATVWFHDEGKINGLPANLYAMVIATVGGWEGHAHGDWIAGPVILTGFDPEEGETIALPPEWASSIMRLV